MTSSFSLQDRKNVKSENISKLYSSQQPQWSAAEGKNIVLRDIKTNALLGCTTYDYCLENSYLLFTFGCV